jgi:hypothetical protein
MRDRTDHPSRFRLLSHMILEPSSASFFPPTTTPVAHQPLQPLQPLPIISIALLLLFLIVSFFSSVPPSHALRGPFAASPGIWNSLLVKPLPA